MTKLKFWFLGGELFEYIVDRDLSPEEVVAYYRAVGVPEAELENIKWREIRKSLRRTRSR